MLGQTEWPSKEEWSCGLLTNYVLLNWEDTFACTVKGTK